MLYFTCVTDAINGNWGDWSTYSSCSQSCDGGTQFRTRTCTNPPPSNGGSYCEGLNVESRFCSLNPCLGKVYDMLLKKLSN